MNGADLDGQSVADATRPWSTEEGVAGFYIVPWRPDPDFHYTFADFLVDVTGGPVEIDFSAVAGFGLMFEFSGR